MGSVRARATSPDNAPEHGRLRALPKKRVVGPRNMHIAVDAPPPYAQTPSRRSSKCVCIVETQVLLPFVLHDHVPSSTVAFCKPERTAKAERRSKNGTNADVMIDALRTVVVLGLRREPGRSRASPA